MQDFYFLHCVYFIVKPQVQEFWLQRSFSNSAVFTHSEMSSVRRKAVHTKGYPFVKLQKHFGNGWPYIHSTGIAGGPSINVNFPFLHPLSTLFIAHFMCSFSIYIFNWISLVQLTLNT